MYCNKKTKETGSLKFNVTSGEEIRHQNFLGSRGIADSPPMSERRNRRRLRNSAPRHRPRHAQNQIHEHYRAQTEPSLVSSVVTNCPLRKKNTYVQPTQDKNSPVGKKWRDPLNLDRAALTIIISYKPGKGKLTSPASSG
jgi:hypothetical protein